MVSMQEVVRLADRFIDPRNPHSIEREGQLNAILLIVAFSHGAAALSLFGMSAWEKGLGRANSYSTVVSIELAKTVMPKNADIEQKVNLKSNPKAFKEYLSSVIKKTSTSQTISKLQATSAPQSSAAIKPRLPQTKSDPNSNQEKSLESKPEDRSKQTNVADQVTGSGTSAPAQQSSTNETMSQTVLPGSATAAATMAGTVNPGGDELDSKSRRSFVTNQQNRASGLITSLPPGGGARLMGNIGPYRKNLLNRIGRNWHPRDLTGNIILLVTLDRDGNLLESEILESSGSKKVDKQALIAVKNTEFAPLPEWFKGEHLKFRVELTSVETSNGRI